MNVLKLLNLPVSYPTRSLKGMAGLSSSGRGKVFFKVLNMGCVKTSEAHGLSYASLKRQMADNSCKSSLNRRFSIFVLISVSPAKQMNEDKEW